MKRTCTRVLRSALSLVLVFCLTLSLCGAAFANESTEINYVSLGDSMTNGYALAGYDYNGYLQDVPQSYPALFAADLEAKTGAKVNLTPLAMSAMRAEDLHFILEFPWENEDAVNVAQMAAWDEAAWNAMFSTGDEYTWDEFTTSNRFNNSVYNKTDFSDGASKNYGAGTANVARTYQEAVANADIVSVGTGNSNLGVFLLGRIMNAIGFSDGDDSWIKLENALRECDADIQSMVMGAYDEIKAQMLSDDLPAELVEPMVNAIAYTMVSYMLNYGGVIEAIVELNPDVEVMIVGLMNTMNGMDFSYNGEIYDLGDYMYAALSCLNAYLAGLPTVLQEMGKYEDATFYYAEASNVDVWVNNFDTEIEINDTIRDRFITEIAGGYDSKGDWKNGMVWGLMGEMVEGMVEGAALVGITRAEVEEYEKLDDTQKATFAAQNTNKAISIAIYLAFEDAICASCNGATMSFDGLLALGNMSGDLFAGVAKDFEDNVGTNGATKFDAACEAMASVVNATAAQNSMSLSSVTKDQIALIYAENPDGDEAITQLATALTGVNIDVKSNVDMLCMLLALPETLSGALQNDEMIFGLLNMFARCLIGDGLGAHPSAAGHEELAAAVIASYDAKHTVKDETIENVKVTLNALYNILETYGPEVAAEVWAQWEEYGYVESVEETMAELKEMLDARYEYYTTEALPAIEGAMTDLVAQKDALCAELDTLKTELEAKKAELAQVIAEQEIGSIHTPNINIDVELGNNEQTQVPDHDCYVDGESVEAELEAAIADLEHAIAVIEALITDIEADIADMVALAEQIAAAVAELEKTMTDIAAAAEDLAAAVEAAVAVLQDNEGVVNAVISSFEAARATVLAAVEVLELTMGTANDMMADIDEMLAVLAEDAEALYNKFITELPGCIEQIPEEGMMLIGGAIAAAQLGLEEGKKLIEENLQTELAALAEEYDINEQTIRAELDKLAAEYGIDEETINAELEAIYTAIETEVNAQYAAIEEQLNADIAALQAEAQAQIEALEAEKAALQAQLAEAAEDAIEGIQAQIDRVTGDIATVNEDLACAIEHLENAAEIAYNEIVAEVTAAYEAAIAELEQALADLEAAYNEAVAELEQKLAELKEAYDKAVDELTAAADAAIAELVAQVEAQLAELEKIGEELAELVDGIYAEIRDELTAAQVAIEEILKGNLDAIEDLKNALVDLGAEAVIDVVESIIAQIEAMFEEATTDDYVITPDSYYVALGDGSAETESYVEELAAYLGIECNNLAEDGQEMADAYGVIADNAEDIAAADLITIGYSNSTFAAEAFNAAVDGVDLDWSTYVTDAGVVYVEDALAEISAELAANGITGDYNARAMDAIEAYAYSSVAYACNLPGVVSAIRAVNEDAVVIIVGQHNAFTGTTLAFEGVEIDLGEYVDYLVTGAAVHGIAYCMITGDAIYVEAPDAATDAPAEIGMDTLIAFMRGDFSVLYPNATGDLYIRDKILNALNITTAGLLGDANSDGKVNNIDAMLVLQYATKAIDASALNLSVCDVNGDGTVNNVDAMLILQYATKAITSFPVEN